MSDKKILADYIWIDGRKPTAHLRSKPRVLDKPVKKLADVPAWGFDGSSTEQAEGHNSDQLLKPIKFIPDPIRSKLHILVLSEVLMPDGSPHESNTRHILQAVTKKYSEHEPLVAVEQEYTLYRKDRPFGWPSDGGFPHPQGRYYCGVGYDEVHGRPLVEAHLQACLEA